MEDKENFAKDINVSHKEQIMINGVDVSKCQDFYISCLTKKDNRYCNCDSDNTRFLRCKDNPDCYYKQLARKTQECEDLRVALKEEVIYKRTYLKSFLDCKEECEELKKENSKLTSLFKELREMKLKTEKQVYELVNENNNLKDLLKRTTCQAECYKHKETERYKQALDDIEEICRQLLDDDYIRSVAESLIDIITKAEDGNNE